MNVPFKSYLFVVNHVKPEWMKWIKHHTPTQYMEHTRTCWKARVQRCATSKHTLVGRLWFFAWRVCVFGGNASCRLRSLRVTTTLVLPSAKHDSVIEPVFDARWVPLAWVANQERCGKAHPLHLGECPGGALKGHAQGRVLMDLRGIASCSCFVSKLLHAVRRLT